jgi:hypothetical protein
MEVINFPAHSLAMPQAEKSWSAKARSRAGSRFTSSSNVAR